MYKVKKKLFKSIGKWLILAIYGYSTYEPAIVFVYSVLYAWWILADWFSLIQHNCLWKINC